jgi:outer membrane receptor protein involved in Fe transport
VAKRAVDRGLIDRFGSLDPTSGGDTHRYSLGAEWARRQADSSSHANAYLVDYGLRLYSNFTYCLKDFAANGNCLLGDQFEQSDRRLIGGVDGRHAWFHELAGRPSDTSVGIELRRDRIDPVGLYLTSARQRHTTIRQDTVTQWSVGAYLQNETQWLEKVRSIVGWRQDWVHFDVSSDTAANSGRAGDSIGGPKLALIFGPWANTEFYLNYGWGFHSNDVRGATITANPDPRDPGFGTAADEVSPLVRSKGAELGLRGAPWRGLQLTAALWRLDLESELLFVGDAGTTEPSRPSKRNGVELAAYYFPYSWLTLDADLAISRARFTDDDPAGNRIPGAIERVFSLGVAVDGPGPWFGGIRLRYFGPRPLIEDDSVRSRASTLVSLKAGYHVSRAIDVSFDVLNLFDREASDIDYYYCSLLSGETGAPGTCADGSAGTDDIHLHPTEPRTFRMAVRLRF